MNNDRLVVVLGLAVVGWYLWTQTTVGSSIAGTTTPIQIGNIPPAFGAGSSVGTGATNVLGGLVASFNNLLGSVITKGPGNAPSTPQASPYGAGAAFSYDTFGNTVYGTPAGVTPSVSPGDIPGASTTVPYLPWTDPTMLIASPPPFDPSVDASSLAFTNNNPSLATVYV